MDIRFGAFSNYILISTIVANNSHIRKCCMSKKVTCYTACITILHVYLNLPYSNIKSTLCLSLFIRLHQRRKRWTDVVQRLYKCFVFAGHTGHLGQKNNEGSGDSYFHSDP